MTIQAPRLALGQRVLHKEVDLQMVTLQVVLPVDSLKDVRVAILPMAEALLKDILKADQEVQVLRQEALPITANLPAGPKGDHHLMVPLSATVDLPPTEQWAATAALLVARVVHLIQVVHLTLVQEPHLPALPQARLDHQELPTPGLPQIFRNYKIPSMPWRSVECKEIQDTAKHEPYTSL